MSTSWRSPPPPCERRRESAACRAADPTPNAGRQRDTGPRGEQGRAGARGVGHEGCAGGRPRAQSRRPARPAAAPAGRRPARRPRRRASDRAAWARRPRPARRSGRAGSAPGPRRCRPVARGVGAVGHDQHAGDAVGAPARRRGVGADRLRRGGGGRVSSALAVISRDFAAGSAFAGMTTVQRTLTSLRTLRGHGSASPTRACGRLHRDTEREGGPGGKAAQAAQAGLRGEAGRRLAVRLARPLLPGLGAVQAALPPHRAHPADRAR